MLLEDRKSENSCSQVLDKLSDDYNFFSDDTEKHMQSPLHPVCGVELGFRLVHLGFRTSRFGVLFGGLSLVKRMEVVCSIGVVICVDVGECVSR